MTEDWTGASVTAEPRGRSAETRWAVGCNYSVSDTVGLQIISNEDQQKNQGSIIRQC